MALDQFMSLTAATAQSATPVTAEQAQQNDVIQARAEATYALAGQEPPTPPSGGIMPHVRGGIGVWLVIVALLWAAFGLYNASMDKRGAGIVASE